MMPLSYAYGYTLTAPPKAKTAAYCTTNVSIPFQESNLKDTCTQERKPHIQHLGYVQDLSPQTIPDLKSAVESAREITEQISLPFAIQQLDGTTSLVLLPLFTNLHGDEAIREMKDKQRRIYMAQPFLQKIMNIFSSMVIGTATIRQVSPQHKQLQTGNNLN